MIKLIDINKIKNHPENPRKDLGDLTELADSIRQSGILQNLTLVPADEGEDEGTEYYALIGNRRLGASKIAGLKEVPCAIAVDMDKKTQIATMLLENMQRSDLTVFEQAQGFQMMLELGETVTDISDKTGFSETTVRRRVKLLDLDQDKLKESSERGATLMDYVELEKIEDIETRNKVLEKVGTNDFDWTLKRAVDDEKRDKRLNEILLEIQKFATETEDTQGLRYKDCFRGSPSDKLVVPADIEQVEYFYQEKHGYLYLYYKDPENEEREKEDEERAIRDRLRQEKKIKLEEMARRSYELRLEFIQSISNTKARKNMDKIIEFVLYTMMESSCHLSYEGLSKLLNINIEDEDDNKIEIWKSIGSQIWKQPELNLLLVVYDTLDSSHEKYSDWGCSYVENEDLDYIYNFLEKLGYKMSEEEKQLQKGTHELFQVEMEV